MPLKRLKRIFFGPVGRLAREDALRIFRRDHFRCPYCGLDGLRHFENWLILTVDHIHPQARGGPRTLDNLVTACQPCNTLKGKRVYASLEEARRSVLARREDWKKVYQETTRPLHAPGTQHPAHSRHAER